MPGTRSAWPQRTTAWGGAMLALGAVLTVIGFLNVGIPITETFVVRIGPDLPAIAAAVLVAVGFAVLAFGAPGELGVAADSLLGRSALLAYGCRALLLVLIGLVPWRIGTGAASVVIGAGWTLLLLATTAALVVAAVIVIRVAVLHGPVRWALLVLGGLDVLLTVAQFVPVARIEIGLASVPIEYARPALLLVVAVLLLLHGRTEAVKHRARMIDDAW